MTFQARRGVTFRLGRQAARRRRWASRLYKAMLIIAFFVLLPSLAGPLGQAAPLVAVAVWPLLRFAHVLVHELGHAAAARLAGGRVTMLMVSPFRFRLQPAAYVHLLPRSERRRGFYGRTEYSFDRRHGRMWGLVSLGGVTASIVIGMTCCLVYTQSRPSLAIALLPSLAILCGGDALINLIPYPGSDGMELLKLRRAARLRLVPPSPRSTP